MSIITTDYKPVAPSVLLEDRISAADKCIAELQKQLISGQQEKAAILLTLRRDQKRTQDAVKEAMENLQNQLKTAYERIALLTSQIAALKSKIVEQADLHTHEVACLKAMIEVKVTDATRERWEEEAPFVENWHLKFLASMKGEDVPPPTLEETRRLQLLTINSKVKLLTQRSTALRELYGVERSLRMQWEKTATDLVQEFFTPKDTDSETSKLLSQKYLLRVLRGDFSPTAEEKSLRESLSERGKVFLLAHRVNDLEAVLKQVFESALK